MDRPIRTLIALYLPLLSAAAAFYSSQSSTVLPLPEHLTHSQLAAQRMYTDNMSTANGVRRAGIDSNLHKYAVRRFLSGRSRTGMAYNVSLPPSLQGIHCQVMRLRAGSLHRRGLFFNNFHIPKGVQVHTGAPFVLVICKSIPRSVSALSYSLPQGYTLISPILGLLVYTLGTPTALDASSLEMNLIGKHPISITMPIDESLYINISHSKEAPLCAFFDINGALSFASVFSPPNTCFSATLMDVALVVFSSSFSSAYAPFSNSTYVSNGPSTEKSSKGSPAKAWRVALIAVLASFCGLAVMGATVTGGIKLQDKRHVAKMVKVPADHQETLHTSVIGHTRAPTAGGVRTKPTLETESLKIRI